MDLRQADAAIKRVKDKLEYQVYLTPTNFAEENKKFLNHYLNGEVYNPQYHYRKFNKRINENALVSIETSLKFEKNNVANLLMQSLLSLKREIAMYRAIGDDDNFTRLAESVVGKPDFTMLPKAEEALKHTKTAQKECNMLDAECLKRAVANRIAYYGFDWRVKLLDNMASRVSVEPETRTVYICKNKKFSEEDILRLCVHEIDTHVLRAENGSRRGLELFCTGTAGSLIHEEGLALYNERKRGVQDGNMMRLYAARFIGCYFSELSFYEIFDKLIKYGCSIEQAMYIVSRNKRGLTDTSKKGGFLKDYVYFQGLYEVDSFLQERPEMYAALYYGSISIEDTATLRDDISKEINNGEVILPSW